MSEFTEDIFFCTFCIVGLLGRWSFNRPLCSSSLRTAICAAINRCLSNINTHFLQAHSLHGQNFLCPFSKAIMPWFRHLAQRGDLVSIFIAPISWISYQKVFRQICEYVTLLLNWVYQYLPRLDCPTWFQISKNGTTFFESISQFYHFWPSNRRENNCSESTAY